MSLTATHVSPYHGGAVQPQTRLSYRDVLQAKARVGHISVLEALAKQLGYEYVLWNDRVYNVTGEAPVDTGVTIHSVY